MIKANELRLGNLVYEMRYGIGDKPVPKSVVEVESINKNQVETTGYGDIGPIPLTKEWLVKLGFNYVDLTIDGNGRTPFYNNYRTDFYIEVYHGESGFSKPKDYHFYWFTGEKIVGLYHVHQLQNLYFALTAEELTLIP